MGDLPDNRHPFPVGVSEAAGGEVPGDESLGDALSAGLDSLIASERSKWPQKREAACVRPG